MKRLLAVLLTAIVSFTSVGCTDQWRFDPANPVSISNNATLTNVIAYSATYAALTKAKATTMDVAAIEGVLVKVKEAVDSYTTVYKKDFYVIGEKNAAEGHKRDKYRSWFFIK